MLDSWGSIIHPLSAHEALIHAAESSNIHPPKIQIKDAVGRLKICLIIFQNDGEDASSFLTSFTSLRILPGVRASKNIRCRFETFN